MKLRLRIDIGLNSAQGHFAMLEMNRGSPKTYVKRPATYTWSRDVRDLETRFHGKQELIKEALDLPAKAIRLRHARVRHAVDGQIISVSRMAHFNEKALKPLESLAGTHNNAKLQSLSVLVFVLRGVNVLRELLTKD